MSYAITDFSKSPVKYIDDAGVEHCIRQRTAVATAVGNIAGDLTKPPRPSRWKLRHIYGVTTVGTTILRKKAVIGDPTNARFVGGTATFSCDGVTWTIEGRVGEKRATG
jgi:hypothetical protein